MQLHRVLQTHPKPVLHAVTQFIPTQLIPLLLATLAPIVTAQAVTAQAATAQAATAQPVPVPAASAGVGLQLRYPAIPDLPPLSPLLPQSSTIRLVLNLTERRVYVYEGDAVKKSYPVAVGRPGWETPTGQFKVMQMLQHPGWTNPFTGEKMQPGAENPLGERWIAFWTDGTNSIGFHGTPNRESVGQAASHGCVRMFNEHIRELYDIVQMGTPVTVEL